MRLLFILCFISVNTFIHSQSILELYEQKNYQALSKFENKSKNLTGEELYMIGFAFFRLEDDEKAIKFYDEAIKKGLDSGYVHFHKGLSLNYLKKYDEALKEVEISLKAEPQNSEYLNEKGLIYFNQKLYDKALFIFSATVKIPNAFSDTYYWYAATFHELYDFDRALKEYYNAAEKLKNNESYYFETLMSIGVLEYTHTKDYKKSAEAYHKALLIDSQNWQLHYKIMKSYNAAKEFSKADSIFKIVKKAFDEGKLPKEDMEIKTVPIAQFEWNGQTASITKSLIDPKESLDVFYKVFLLNKEGDAVVRRFLIEKTTPLGEDPILYLLCEKDKKTGTHYTYPYGWKNENINSAEIEKAIKLVLDGKIKSGASSNFKK